MAKDLYMEIYGRPAADWELDQTMGMPEDQLRAVLESSWRDWQASQSAPAKQQPQPEFVITNDFGAPQQSNSTIPDGISDGVLGWLGFESRDQYRQAMADAAAARANDTSGFVTGGGNYSSPSSSMAQTQQQAGPVFVTGPGPSANPVQQLTGARPTAQPSGASAGYSAMPQMVGAMGTGPAATEGFYQSNLIKSLRDASALDRPQGNPGVTFMPNTPNTSGGASFAPLDTSGLVFNPQPTDIATYDPTSIFQEIYGRNPTASELEYARNKRPADLRTTLEQSLAEWQAKQNGTFGPQPDQQNTVYNFSDA